MATIEPRLIHLLNESTATPRPHHAELPPIKDPRFRDASGRPHPIEPDAGQLGESTESNGSQLHPQAIHPTHSAAEESPPGANNNSRKEGKHAADRTLLTHISSQDLRMILDDTPENSEDLSHKKRPVKEDFVQLPQPLKKQKAAVQQHRFPPMIVGLVEPPEPPLNPSLFPPISSASFDERPHSEPPQHLGLNKPAETQQTTEAKPAETERTPTAKNKRRAAKPRRKWSEEETNHLLLGVSKHGVGRWTDILEDAEYKFNDRTAGDLKDRFRTCCPAELQVGATKKIDAVEDKSSPPSSASKPKKGLMAENILNETEDAAEDKHQTLHNELDSTPKQRKSRAHRKKMEDLVELGIKGPFKKSHRRERRPFSEQDDRDILEGFELYGPQWTKIQRDPRFNLSTRQPTDLRDRLRNKYPEKFAGTEKTAVQVKEPGHGSSLLEPTVDMPIGKSLHVSKSAFLEPQLMRTNSKEDMPKWPPPSNLVETGEASQGPANVFWNDATGSGFAPGGISEMDISRLLLDERGASDSSPDKRGLG